MVLYHPDGRVVKAHEDRLEKEAQKNADNWNHRFTDQIVIAKSKDLEACKAENIKVRIVVAVQEYRELYVQEWTSLIGEKLDDFDVLEASDPMPREGLDRKTLMMCSSYANDFFTYKPNATILELPVCYPRLHITGYTSLEEVNQFEAEFRDRIFPDDIEAKKTYRGQLDNQMAYIRADELRAYIIPWLKKMEEASETKDISLLPLVVIPDSLLEKIHLYNAMLQLGIPSHFQKDLIDALILQMYQTDLNRCHLDTLEMTVARFYARGVAILDPVLNHFIGTYSLRSAEDRENYKPASGLKVLSDVQKAPDERNEDTELYLPRKQENIRDWLEYKTGEPSGRIWFPNDTVSVPPKLEVIGNSIRQWSGIRRNGNTAPAHTGLPLNVGRVLKYYRRSPRDSIHTKPEPDSKSTKDPKGKADDSDKDDDNDKGNTKKRKRSEPVDVSDLKDVITRNYKDCSTHRLKHVKYFWENPPGARNTPTTPTTPTETEPAQPESPET